MLKNPLLCHAPPPRPRLVSSIRLRELRRGFVLARRIASVHLVPRTPGQQALHGAGPQCVNRSGSVLGLGNQCRFESELGEVGEVVAKVREAL